MASIPPLAASFQAFLHFQFWSLAVYDANDGFIPGPFFFTQVPVMIASVPTAIAAPKYLGRGVGRPGNKAILATYNEKLEVRELWGA